MKRAYVDTPDGQIHYRTEGSGEPLLLLHMVALSSDEYVEMMPTLGKSYYVIAMDTPGYGFSDKLPHKYTVADYAKSVVGFMDALGVKKASVVGSHTGATIAVELAATYPKRVDKLMLSGCPYYEPEVLEARLNDPRFASMKIKDDGSHIMKVWEGQMNYAPSQPPKKWHRVVVNYMLAGMDAEDGHQAIFRYNIKERLPLIKSPTLLISGTEDVFYNLLEKTKSFIPRCKTQVIEGGGIVIGYGQPKEFAQAIIDFMANPGV